MGPSLRTRISKRNTDATQKEDSTANSPPSTFLAALDHSDHPTTVDKENIAIPQLEAALLRKPEKPRFSSSKSLLHRYKSRAPKRSTTGSPANMDAASSAPDLSDAVTGSRGKSPAFTENFNQSKSATELTTPPKAASTTTSKSTIRRVDGVDFEMMDPSQVPMKLQRRGVSAEPPRGRYTGYRTDEDYNARSRSEHASRSRSQTKKEERSDSTIGDVDGDAAKALAATTEQPSSTEQATSKPESLRSRMTLKKKTTNDPAPSPSKPKIPRLTRAIAAHNATIGLLANEASASDSDSSASSSSSTGGRVGRTLSRPDQPISKTRVVPPVAFCHLLPGMVWASTLSGTSRPDAPWLWCKRWICCRCEASTIVEQGICARLSCGHLRCGGRCEIAREKRAPFPY